MLPGFCDKKNKDEKQLKQTHPTDIIEVTQSDTDIPYERTFLKQLVMSFCQEKGIYRKNNCMYARIHFSKSVTDIHEVCK